MTTEIEALRRAFEAFSLDGGLTPGDLEWNGRFYIVPFTQDEWLTFQAGHAAAKAETADVGEPVAFAHFAENGNIRLWAPERPRDLDGNAAHPLYTAEQLAAAVAAGPENDMQYLVDEFEKSLPPMGHPLRKLGVRLTELLDEDQWAECERLLLEGWEHDAADRATGARWRANSSLEEWFPYTHEELARLRETLQGIADADWRRWEELATPDEFVRWAKSRAAHALRAGAKNDG